MKKITFIMSLLFVVLGIYAQEIPFELTSSDLPESTTWYQITVDGKYVYADGQNIMYSKTASYNKDHLWAFVAEGKDNFYILNRAVGSGSKVYVEDGVVCKDKSLVMSKEKGRKFKWESTNGLSTIYTKSLCKYYVNLNYGKLVYGLEAANNIRFIRYGTDAEVQAKQEEMRKQMEERKKTFCVVAMPQSRNTKYDSSDCLVEINYLTDFKNISEISQLNEFRDTSMFTSEPIRLGKLNDQYCIETKDGSIFVLGEIKYRLAVKKMLIRGNTIEFSSYEGNNLAINGVNCSIESLDKPIGLNEYYIFDGEFDKEPKYNANGLYCWNKNDSSTLILTVNGQPVKLPLNALDRVHSFILPEVKTAIRNQFNNADLCSFILFNKYKEITRNCAGYMSELIYHGKNYTQDWQRRYNLKNKKNTASVKAEYLARCKKYGKKYVDIRDSYGIPVVGMPEGLAMEYGLELIEQGKGYKICNVMGFRCKLTIRNGKVFRVVTW